MVVMIIEIKLILEVTIKKSRFCVSNVCVALDEGIIPKVLHSGYGCVSFVAVVVVGGWSGPMWSAIAA